MSFDETTKMEKFTHVEFNSAKVYSFLLVSHVFIILFLNL